MSLRECKTVAEMFVQKCSTLQEQVCSTVQETECFTRRQQKCDTVEEEECETVEEDECRTVNKAGRANHQQVSLHLCVEMSDMSWV